MPLSNTSVCALILGVQVEERVDDAKPHKQQETLPRLTRQHPSDSLFGELHQIQQKVRAGRAGEPQARQPRFAHADGIGDGHDHGDHQGWYLADHA